MTTREACGNSVRNITACPYAGVADGRGVRRHAVRRGADALLPAPSAELGRCRASSRSPSRLLRGSHRTAINDIGWNARVETVDGAAPARVPGDRRRRHRDDDRGGPRAVRVPARRARCSTCAEAIVRVFHRLGDYKHKQRNRMKFLVKRSAGTGFARSTSEELASSVPAGGGAAVRSRSGRR